MLTDVVSHLDCSRTQVVGINMDTAHIKIRNGGMCSIIDFGVTDKSNIYAVSYDGKRGRVYLPFWYQPKMTAYYFDRLFCAYLLDRDKADKMLEGYNPQVGTSQALDRLADMSYAPDWSVRAIPSADSVMIQWSKADHWYPYIGITPVDFCFASVIHVSTDGYTKDSHRLEYPYELDDVVAYMMLCDAILREDGS